MTAQIELIPVLNRCFLCCIVHPYAGTGKAGLSGSARRLYLLIEIVTTSASALTADLLLLALAALAALLVALVPADAVVLLDVLRGDVRALLESQNFAAGSRVKVREKTA